MIQFKYGEISYSEDSRDKMLKALVLNFMNTSEFKNDKTFAPENDEYELKLTIKGNYEIDLNIEKLLQWMMQYGQEIEQENRQLKDKLNSIRSKVNQFIDEEEC